MSSVRIWPPRPLSNPKIYLRSNDGLVSETIWFNPEINLFHAAMAVFGIMWPLLRLLYCFDLLIFRYHLVVRELRKQISNLSSNAKPTMSRLISGGKLSDHGNSRNGLEKSAH